MVSTIPGSDTPYSTPPMSCPAAPRPLGFSGSSRSISSVSSSSISSSDYSPDDYSSSSSPDTPLQFSRIPFSWEEIPGIPKKDIPKKQDSSLSQFRLPLPPSGNTSKQTRKQSLLEEFSPKNSFKKDPFFVALMECSKDDDHEQYVSLRNIWKGSKMVKDKNYGFGFIEMYTSCKRTCSVSESVVYLPRSRSYNLVNQRSRS